MTRNGSAKKTDEAGVTEKVSGGKGSDEYNRVKAGNEHHEMVLSVHIVGKYE